MGREVIFVAIAALLVALASFAVVMAGEHKERSRWHDALRETLKQNFLLAIASIPGLDFKMSHQKSVDSDVYIFSNEETKGTIAFVRIRWGCAPEGVNAIEYRVGAMLQLETVPIFEVSTVLDRIVEYFAASPSG